MVKFVGLYGYESLPKPVAKRAVTGFGAKLKSTTIVKAMEIKAAPPPVSVPVDPWKFTIGNFPYCCGAEIVYDFPASYTDRDRARLDKAFEDFKQKRRIGAAFAVLADYQFGYRATLLKYGWKSTGEFVNPNHSSKCEGFVFDHEYDR